MQLSSGLFNNVLNRSKVRHIHLVGIGGVGMGGIAEILLKLGFMVSGSDQSSNDLTQRLAKKGAKIFIGHHAAYFEGAQLVVISTAIQENNPEVMAAKAKGIPIFHRAAILGELMRLSQGIAIAGTHGKTTTTSLMVSLLLEDEQDPSFAIGGSLNSLNTYAQLGTGDFFVVEADESDASFLHLHPWLAIVTNVDSDHLTAYKNEFLHLQQAFLKFLNHLPFYGLAVLCMDDPILRQLLPSVTTPYVTYGFSEEAEVRAIDFIQRGLISYFSVVRPGLAPLPIMLNMGGKHNVQNALATIAVATHLGIKDEVIMASLANFAGVGRRMQVYGDLTLAHQQGRALLIDDYGHHPKEITATLEAIRQAYPNRRLVVAYQPHRYSRTQALFDEFVTALSAADVLFLLTIYSAGEVPIVNVTSTGLGKVIREQSGKPVFSVEKVADLPEVLGQHLQDEDVLLVQGAGDIGNVAPQLLAGGMCLTSIEQEFSFSSLVSPMLLQQEGG